MKEIMEKRILGAILILAIFLPLLFLGCECFAVMIALLGMLGFRELWNVRFKKKKKENQVPLTLKVLSYGCLLFLILNNWSSNEFKIVLDYRVLSLCLIIFFLPIIILADEKKYNLEDAMFLMGSVIFLGLSFNLIILTRNYSLNYILYFLIITTVTDTFALITGILVGRHKLIESISPGKTVEGLLGGTIMGVFVATVFYMTVINSSIDPIQLGIVTVTLSLMGQLGDLVFSAIKRHYDEKDFSNLIPGHGGILDRFDSIIFVVITATLFMSII